MDRSALEALQRFEDYDDDFGAVVFGLLGDHREVPVPVGEREQVI
jgi:hypothetical protein